VNGFLKDTGKVKVSVLLLNSDTTVQVCDPAHFTQGHPAGHAARDADSSTTGGNISIYFSFFPYYQSDKLG